ncbi:MAG: DUF4838 domain-containing protein [Fidelibacterota bacterium]|nr:MAG: DUF4838 domain-containing protein [Candidatus Neomarinimicrobiota bacterium]
MVNTPQTEYFLVKDGEAVAAIVLADEADAVERNAAEELRRYLFKVTDAEVPIVSHGVGDDSFLILIGRVNEGFGLDHPELGKEGFLLRTADHRLHIVGADESGLQFGIYSFLEDYCGIRWFWPGELGEVVPKTPTVGIPAIDRTEAPNFRWRNRGPGGPLWGPDDRISKQRKLGVSERHIEEVALWERRNKWGGLNVQGGHEWGNIVHPDKYGSDHPEYYALVDGRRDRDFEHFDGKHGAQLCTTNPDLVPIFRTYFDEYFEEHPECDALHVTPNDGGGFCECEHCRALDTGKRLKNRPEKPVITDRIFTFTNRLGEELQQVHPGKQLVNMAYSWYVDPPENITISENVIPQYCMWSCYLHWNEEKKREHYEIVRGWAEVARHVGIYEYYINGAWPDLPRIIYPKIEESLRFLHSVGVGLYQTQSGDGFAINGLNYYIASKLLWDVDADVEALVDDFYTKAFGAAGSWVRRCYERLQDRWGEVVAGGLHPSCSSFATTQVHEVYPREILEACRGDLEAALKEADEPLIKRRVEFVQQGLTYTELTLEAVRITKEVENQGVTISAVDFTDEEEIRRVSQDNERRLHEEPELQELIKSALEAWEARDRYVDELKDDYVISYFWVKYNDENRVFNPTRRLREMLAD